MDVEEKMKLVAKPPTEEIVTQQDLRELLETVQHPKHYIGVEISGLLHLGSLIITGFKINDFIKAGLKCTVFLADWHSYINNKFGGDWEKIRRASEYYREAFRFFCPGVEVTLGSELYAENAQYWESLVRFSKHITLPRAIRCLTIMGRSEREKLDFAQYLYPPMQSVDIKTLDLDLVHAGMDQRKVHMLVREVFPKLKWKTPVAVHHHLLPGLDEPVSLGLDDSPRMDRVISSKMSKSKPWTCIFIHDSREQIEKKLGRAWCPERAVENNPVMEIAKYLILHERGIFDVARPSRYGGPVSFSHYDELEQAYREQRLHPADLKRAVSAYLNEIVAPIREHFLNRKSLLEVYQEEGGSET